MYCSTLIQSLLSKSPFSDSFMSWLHKINGLVPPSCWKCQSSVNHLLQIKFTTFNHLFMGLSMNSSCMCIWRTPVPMILWDQKSHKQDDKMYHLKIMNYLSATFQTPYIYHNLMLNYTKPHGNNFLKEMYIKPPQKEYFVLHFYSHSSKRIRTLAIIQHFYFVDLSVWSRPTFIFLRNLDI